MNTKISFVWMAAVILTAFTLGACSKAQDPALPEQQTVTLTTTLSPRSGALTRSTLTDTGSGLDAAWEVGDEIMVYYDDNGGTNPTGRARVSAVDAGGNATVVAELTDPKDGGNIMFGFPYQHWAEGDDPHSGQNGTLEKINAMYNVCYGNGKLVVSGSEVSLDGTVTMDPEMCIWKFTFSDGTEDITSNITQLTVNCGPYDDYEVYPAHWPYQDTYYVALYPQVDATITISVKKPNPPYVAKTLSVSKSGITLDAGKLYTSTGLVVTE